MSNNNGFERKQFNRQQGRLADKYRKAGMSEADIQAMREYDNAIFCQYRRDKEHAVDASAMVTTDESTRDSRYMDMDELPAGAPLVLYGDRYSWIDEIDDPELHKAIVSMKPDYIEIVTLMMEGYVQRDIAKKMHVGNAVICRKVKRIKNILNDFLQKVNF